MIEEAPHQLTPQSRLTPSMMQVAPHAFGAGLSQAAGQRVARARRRRRSRQKVDGRVGAVPEHQRQIEGHIIHRLERELVNIQQVLNQSGAVEVPTDNEQHRSHATHLVIEERAASNGHDTPRVGVQFHPGLASFVVGFGLVFGFHLGVVKDCRLFLLLLLVLLLCLP